MKNLNIMGVHWKIPFLGWGVHEKPIYRRELPKKGGLGQFAELRGGGAWRKRGGLIPQYPNCNTWFTGTQHLTSIEDQWRYTDGSIGCKNFSRTSFPSTEISSLIPSYYFFRTGNSHDCPNFISFLWMETGCKRGSTDKFENGNYILMQSHSKMRDSLVLFWIQERTWW